MRFLGCVAQIPVGQYLPSQWFIRYSPMGYRTDIVNLSLSFEVTIIIFQIPIKGPFDDCKRQAKAKIFSICTKLFILCYTG